jgi:hypothetical protein
MLICIGIFVAGSVMTGHLVAQSAPAPKETASGLRVAAEWEPAIGVLIGWPRKLPKALIVEMAKDVDLYVTVRDDQREARARTRLVSWGVDLARLHFVRTQQGDAYHVSREQESLPRTAPTAFYSFAVEGE